MPGKRATHKLGPDGLCPECEQRHVTKHGHLSCAGHVRFNNDPTSPDYRKRLPQPRPCQNDPAHGLTRCVHHGAGSKRVQAAGKQRAAEAEVAQVARKLIPDLADRAAITNPLETLLELASEANAFRESLRVMANQLDGKIRYAAGAGSGEQLRAEVATYRQAFKDTTDVLVAIARLDIEKMLARITVAQAEQSMAAMRAGMDDANLDEDQKRKVMGGVARHLRIVVPPIAS